MATSSSLITSPMPHIVLRYTTASAGDSALVVNSADFDDLMVLAAHALHLDQDVVEIVYDDDEGEPVLIGSQTELDEALQQNHNHLFGRIISKIARQTTSLSTKIAKSPMKGSAGQFPSLGTLIVFMAVVPCLVVAIAALMAIPGSKPAAVTDSCPNLMQHWVSAIESELMSSDLERIAPVYDLLNVCPHDLALFWIGRYEYLQGNTCDALERFTSAAKLNPGHAASHLWMGRCLDLLDRPGDALKAFAAAAHLAPYLAEAQFEYGRALSSADVVSSAALAAASAAVTSDANFDEARLLKGRLAYERGDADSAYSEFSILTARHPDSSDYQIWKRRAFDEILRGR